jgi:hypothetical protein
MDTTHLRELADANDEIAAIWRWLAGLARKAGEEVKAADVEAKAAAIDVASAFIRGVADEIDAANDAE